MFNRRFLREKTVQAYYGFFQGGAESALACQKNLLAGLDQTAELYYLQLSFLLSLSEYAGEKYRQAVERGRRTAEELESIRLMAHNKAIDLIRNDVNYILKSESYHFNWRDRQSDLFSAVYDAVFVTKDGSSAAGRIQENIRLNDSAPADVEGESSDDAFEQDREFLRKLYKRKIATNPVLRSYCEERSIFWESDYESVIFWVYSLIARMSPERNNNVDPGWTIEDPAVAFGKSLLEKTLLHQDEYHEYIAARLQNWKHERVGATEKVLLCVAVSELINFPSIPVKVTLNEYIELAKRFCGQESYIFVNGVLNKIAQDLKADKKIQKSGRGLIE